MHRDIKPQNLLIDKLTLTVKIADWGLADFYLHDT
jgi:serine/threonine protein kinase